MGLLPRFPSRIVQYAGVFGRVGRRMVLVSGLKKENQKEEKRHKESMTSSASNRLAAAPENLFRSFWIGGFECSSHVNRFGTRLDMTAAVGHDRFAEQDYALMRSAGLLTARDGLRWHLIDHGGKYDFSSFVPMLRASLHHGVQVIWDLFHYGYPDDIDILKPAFVGRFARYCAAAARVFAESRSGVWGRSRESRYPRFPRGTFAAGVVPRARLPPPDWRRGKMPRDAGAHFRSSNCRIRRHGGLWVFYQCGPR